MILFSEWTRLNLESPLRSAFQALSDAFHHYARHAPIEPA
jgi:hypothetical protein